jgi:hypothetical protein
VDNYKGANVEMKKEYSSDDEVLDFKGTVALLTKHGLMDITKADESNSSELLR